MDWGGLMYLPSPKPEGRPGGSGKNKRAKEGPPLAVLKSPGHHGLPAGSWIPGKSIKLYPNP